MTKRNEICCLYTYEVKGCCMGLHHGITRKSSKITRVQLLQNVIFDRYCPSPSIQTCPVMG